MEMLTLYGGFGLDSNAGKYAAVYHAKSNKEVRNILIIWQTKNNDCF